HPPRKSSPVLRRAPRKRAPRDALRAVRRLFTPPPAFLSHHTLSGPLLPSAVESCHRDAFAETPAHRRASSPGHALRPARSSGSRRGEREVGACMRKEVLLSTLGAVGCARPAAARRYL